jgi:hypothetical protein
MKNSIRTWILAFIAAAAAFVLIPSVHAEDQEAAPGAEEGTVANNPTENPQTPANVPTTEPETPRYLVHCPDPTTIKETKIPYSLHNFYTAVSDGIGFSGMDITVVDPKKMTLAVAEVDSVNDYWSFYCTYQGNGLVLNLSANINKIYKECTFADGTQKCQGTIEACTLSCPTKPGK